jgi:MFS family permease
MLDRAARNILLLSLSQACVMILTSTLLAEAALVGYALAPDKSLATLPLALQQVGVMLTTIPASLLMQRIGRKAGFSIGALFGIAGSIIALIGTLQASFWLFCLGTALNGGFSGFATYFRFAAVESASPAWKSRAISYVLAGGVIAAAVGPEMAKYTNDLLAPIAFAGSFASLIGVAIVALIILQFLDMPVPRAEGAHDPGRPLLEIAAQPVFIVAVIGGVVGYGVMAFIMTATPLAMQACGFAFNATASVIQWHVMAMFAPSFVTGHIIARIGVLNVMLIGAGLLFACAAVDLAGIELWNFFVGLVALGIGWNFLYVGGTALLTEAYRPAERAKVQAANDFLIFGTLAFASLSSGAVVQQLGWDIVNIAPLPLVAVAFAATLWLALRRRAATA